MTVRYHQRGERLMPDYLCQARSIQRGQPACQHIPGNSLDDAIGKLLIDTVTPLTLEVALAVQTELESRCDEAERLRSHEVERARYQSDLARQRFMHVDPANRLVADTLEAEWNQALRALADAKERYEKQRQTCRTYRRAASHYYSSGNRLPSIVERLAQATKRKRMARLLIALLHRILGTAVWTI